MAFLVINGVTIDVEYGSWKEEPIDVGELSARSLAARPARARGTKVRRFTFRTTPTEMSAAEMEKLALWIEGEGQSWKFDGTLFSGNGVQKTASGTTTASASGGYFGGRVTVASGSVFGVKMSNKLGKAGGWLATVHGWSLLSKRKFVAGETASAGWRDCLLSGAVNFTRGSAANPVGVTQYVDGVAAPAANLGQCFSVGLSDPYTGLHGYETDDSAAAVDFDDFAFYPFDLPSTWVADIAAWRALYSWSSLPRVKAWGDVFSTGLDVAPVEVIGTVTSKDVTQIVEGGVVKNTLRSLTVMLEEWATRTNAIEEPIAEIIPGALFTLDADDHASLTLSGSEITNIENSGGANTREMNTSIAANPGPTTVAAVVNGRAVARFVTAAGFASRAIALRADIGGILRTDASSWFANVYNTTTPSLTRYCVVNFASIRTATGTNRDILWCGSTVGGLGVHVRNDGLGAYKAAARFIETPSTARETGEATISLATWHVIAVRLGGGTLELRVDGGAWNSVACGALAISNGPIAFGKNSSSGRGGDFDLAYCADYAARHTDAEADEMLEALQAEILGL